VQEAFDASQSSLEVADAARRALQEEVKRLADEKDRAVATVAEYVASVGELPKARAGAVSERVVADRNVSASIISVRREKGTTLAEINAGSRDGVKAAAAYGGQINYESRIKRNKSFKCSAVTLPVRRE